MDDENGLDLSLGLLCGGASASQKGKIGSSSESRTDEGDRDAKLINEFKTFLEGGSTQKQGLSSGSNRNDQAEGNFYNSLTNVAADTDTSRNSNSGGMWMTNNGKSAEVEEGRRPEIGEKRKNLFGDTSQQKKQERETQRADSHDKPKVSHISITTDDASTADNEDVGDSEADGTTSRLISQHDSGSKRYVGRSSSHHEVHKTAHEVPDSGGVALSGPNRFTVSSDKEFQLGKMPYGTPFPGQPVNLINMPYSLNVKGSAGASGASNNQFPAPVHGAAAANIEKLTSQPVIPANVPLMFSYSAVQLPTVDKDVSQGLTSYAGRSILNSDKLNSVLNMTQASMPVSHKSSESMQYKGREMEHVKDNGRHVAEEASSSHREDDAKGSNTIFRAKDPSEQPRSEGVPSEYPAIRPGLAADVKFGGSGSCPNLPWVSTTGPSGKTISGVTYRFSPTQIKIVCACHGSHMSPDEFVRHTGEEQNNPDVSNGVASFPSNNPAAST